MYERILVPLDSSEVAELVLPYAEELAGRLGSEIRLLTVAPSSKEKEQQAAREYLERTAQATRQKAGRHLDKAAGGAVSVGAVLLSGDTAEEIVQYAEKESIGLIIMATHGRSGIKRWAMGSVADKVVRATGQPVALIRARGVRSDLREKGVVNTMLVPLDGSDESEAVIPYVEELASKLKASVILFQAVPRAYHIQAIADGVAQIPYSDDEMQPLKAGADAYLSKVASRLADKGISTDQRSRIGKAAEEIIKVGDELHSDLVAMSTHGRSGIDRWVMGSVADKVLRGGNTPVMLMRVPEGKGE